MITALANKTLVTKSEHYRDEYKILDAVQGDLKSTIFLESLEQAKWSNGKTVKLSVYPGDRDSIISIVAGCFHEDSNFWEIIKEVFGDDFRDSRGRELNIDHCNILYDFNHIPIYSNSTDMVSALESYYKNLIKRG